MAQEPPSLPPTPIISEDGLWWWDGIRWMPRSSQPIPPPPPQSVTVTQTSSNPFVTGLLACLGVIVALLVVGVVLFLVMGSCIAANMGNSTPTP